MEIKAPGFVQGNVARGGDFWGREDEIKEILQAVEKGSVLLKAPRRFGKSSIMNYINENPPESFIKSIYIYAEKMNKPSDFISSIMAEMLKDNIIRKKLKSMAGWLKKLVTTIDEIGIAEFRIALKDNIDTDWQSKGEEMISYLSELDGNVLIFVDELPLFIHRLHKGGDEMQSADFLNWFRYIRQSNNLSHLKWVTAGSIGIEHILKLVKVSTSVINDFKPIIVGPFKDDNARLYIKSLYKNESKGSNIKDDMVDNIMKTIGTAVPFFIQILLKECISEMNIAKKSSLDLEIINHAYKETVLGTASRTYFDHFFTRLDDYYDAKLVKVAKRLILELARRESVEKTHLLKIFRSETKGELLDETFSGLMRDIESDFYCLYNIDNETYTFHTKILKDWWLRYYDLMES